MAPNEIVNNIKSTPNDKQQEKEERLNDLPREMIGCIVSFCDPRSLVNIICTSKSLRAITVQILLMGPSSEDIVVEGMPITTWYSDGVNETPGIYPFNLLSRYLDLLMKEEEVEMDRINLSPFGELGTKDLAKVSKFIAKFKIPELISPHYYDWIKKEINSSLSSVTRLSFTKELVAEDSNYFHTLLKRPFTVLNGLCVKNGHDVKNLCQNTQICSSLKALTLSVYNSVAGYAFKQVLKSFPFLKEFNFFIFGTPNYPDDFEIDEELIEIMCNSKLEILRLDNTYLYNRIKFVNKVTDNKRNSIFPQLKIYSNHIGNADIDSPFMPEHALETISVKIFKETSVPKSNNFFAHSAQGMSLPIVETNKMYISTTNIRNGLCENLAACTFLKELHLYEVVAHSELSFEWKDIQNTLEILNIKKSEIGKMILNNLIDNSPNLKSVTLQKVKVRGIKNSTDLVIENQDVDSQLRYIFISNCSELYPDVFSNMIKRNLPFLQTVILDSTYSITKNSLTTLFNKASSLSVVKITGAEFSDDLIAKFFNSFNPISLDYGIDFCFNGKHITSLFILEQPYLDKVVTFYLPDCVIPNDDFIQILDKMNPKMLKKIHVNLGKTGPTLPTLEKVKEFKSLEMVYLVGSPENKIKNFENYVLTEFVSNIPNLVLLYMDHGEFIKEDIELSKNKVRSSGKSAPKLILPQSKKDVVYSIESNRSGIKYCSLQ